jgi:hypothetical protein
MLLGGFLKQMNDTIRYNLDLREKIRRKPDKQYGNVRKQNLKETIRMTALERNQLLSKIEREQQTDKQKRYAALLVSTVLTALIFWLFWQIVG